MEFGLYFMFFIIELIFAQDMINLDSNSLLFDPTRREPVPNFDPTRREPVPNFDPTRREPVPNFDPTRREPVPNFDQTGLGPLPNFDPVPNFDPTKREPVPNFDPTRREPVPNFDPTSREPVPNFDPTSREPAPIFDPTRSQPVPNFDPTRREPVPNFDPTRREPVPNFDQTGLEPLPNFDSVPNFDPTNREPVPNFDPTSREPAPIFDPTRSQPVPNFDPTRREPDPNFNPARIEPVPIFDQSRGEPVPNLDPTRPEPVQNFDPTRLEPVPIFDPTRPVPVPNFNPTRLEPIPNLDPTRSEPVPNLDLTRRENVPIFDPTRNQPDPNFDPTRRGPIPNIDQTRLEPVPNIDIPLPPDQTSGFFVDRDGRKLRDHPVLRGKGNSRNDFSDILSIDIRDRPLLKTIRKVMNRKKSAAGDVPDVDWLGFIQRLGNDWTSDPRSQLDKIRPIKNENRPRNIIGFNPRDSTVDNTFPNQTPQNLNGHPNAIPVIDNQTPDVLAKNRDGKTTKEDKWVKTLIRRDDWLQRATPNDNTINNIDHSRGPPNNFIENANIPLDFPLQRVMSMNFSENPLLQEHLRRGFGGPADHNLLNNVRPSLFQRRITGRRGPPVPPFMPGHRFPNDNRGETGIVPRFPLTRPRERPINVPRGGRVPFPANNMPNPFNFVPPNELTRRMNSFPINRDFRRGIISMNRRQRWNNFARRNIRPIPRRRINERFLDAIGDRFRNNVPFRTPRPQFVRGQPRSPRMQFRPRPSFMGGGQPGLQLPPRPPFIGGGPLGSTGLPFSQGGITFDAPPLQLPDIEQNMFAGGGGLDRTNPQFGPPSQAPGTGNQQFQQEFNQGLGTGVFNALETLEDLKLGPFQSRRRMVNPGLTSGRFDSEMLAPTSRQSLLALAMLLDETNDPETVVTKRGSVKPVMKDMAKVIVENVKFQKRINTLEKTESEKDSRT